MSHLPAILQELLSMLNGIHPSDTAFLFALAQPVKLEAGEAYIREGDTTKRLAFIEEGIMRAYSHKGNGDEATLFFRWEGQFIASHDAIIHQKPARFIYRAITPVRLMEINYDQLETMLKDHPEFEPLRNYFLMKMLAEALDAIESFVMLSPEERYLQLIEHRKDLVNRVPDKHIASMLGITPVSLSRIRKRILHKR